MANELGAWAASLGLALGLTGCAWSDSRPILVNQSETSLQVESLHSDGQRLKTLLYPGARIGLGLAGAPVETIQLVRDGEEVEDGTLLSVDQVAQCMAAPSICLGWKLTPDGAVVRIRPGELDAD